MIRAEGNFKQMKITILPVLALTTVLTLSSVALADSSRSEYLQNQAQRLSRIENDLNPQDRDALDHYLAMIDRVIDHYRPSTPAYVCVSNGETGPFEKFTVTDPATGTHYGAETTLSSCKQAIQGVNQGLICASNGESGAFEKFVPLDLTRQKNLGGYT